MIDNFTKLKVLSLLRDVGKTIKLMQGDPVWRKVLFIDGFKTVGDLKAHEMLITGLHKITPHISVFSEETPHLISERPSQYWLIDPIDGTSSWHNGFEGYVTQIALISNNQVDLGAIYWPCRNIMFHADNSGVFINKVPFNYLKSNDPKILVDNYPKPRGIAAELIKRIPKLRYRECGSLGLKSVLALTGEVDIFVKDVIIRDWDMAPVFPFTKFGGYICDLSGQPLVLGKKIEFDNGLIVSHNQSCVKKVSMLIASIKNLQNYKELH